MMTRLPSCNVSLLSRLHTDKYVSWDAAVVKTVDRPVRELLHTTWYGAGHTRGAMAKRSLKRRMRDPDVTRQRLLTAAFEEIYRRGFQAASLESILVNAGVT